MIKGIFNLDAFDFRSQTDFHKLLITGQVNELFVLQSFPTLFVNMTQPLYAEDICKPENGCLLEPDWGRFVGLGVRDTVINFGVHYGAPVAWRWMRNAWRISRGTIQTGGGIRSLLATLNSAPEASAAMHISTASINSNVFEMAPLTSFTTSGASGIITQGAQRGTLTAIRAWNSAPELTTLVKLSSGEAGGMVAESSINALNRASLAARTSWLPRIASWLSKLRFRREVRTVTHVKTLEHNRTKRGLWSGTMNALRSMPSWTIPAVLSGVTWTVHGITNLRTVDLEVKAFYPIVKLTELERFYTASTAIILNSCFLNKTLVNTLINSDSSLGRTVLTLSGREFRNVDLVFDLSTGRAGPILHACSPLFKTKFHGYSEDFLLRTLSMLFSAAAVVDKKFYYVGLPAYIDADKAAYLNDISPKFRPLVYNAEVVDNTDDLRFKRSKRASTMLPRNEYGPITFSSSQDFTSSVIGLITHPRAIYEYDMASTSVYNTSANYFRNIRYYMH